MELVDECSNDTISLMSEKIQEFPFPMPTSSSAAAVASAAQEVSTSSSKRSSNSSSNSNSEIRFPACEEIDRMVAQAMLELSPQDRERALEELHGVVEVDSEDPSFIASCLDDLDNCLATTKRNTAYEEAERMSYAYVSNNRFRMMFLRSVRYVPQDAAERMINFFEYKRELFGRDKLVKDLAFEDLHPDDLPTMEGGYIQVSPIKDQVGRPIFFFFEKVKRQYAQQAENAIRSQFYTYMTLLEESEEAQKTGVVIIVYTVDCKGSTNSYGSRLRNSLPLKFASIHFCLNDEREYERITQPMEKLDSNARSRYRPHFGSSEECQAKLTAYGIPKGILPVAPDGTILLEDYNAWMSRRRQLEQQRQQQQQLEAGNSIQRIDSPPPSSDNSSTGIPANGLMPTPGDILFGRGRKVRDHAGNARFLNLVDHYMAKYESAGRVDKACIAEIIVRMIKDAGCRFLKKGDQDVWGEVADSEARKKVAHAFRNRRKLHGYGQ
mmetsp:Transcript_34922/g.84520  ORF Transcript_34922/g.84520 Transcript_34922/m.84520 type:complete len:495 (+) Transcript_34922:226-1710(+)|eukprot:CAMPEP_0113627678 /NCGR_PEP_ID=MMETSP0017_2-20120614/14337_1 /TAXON_ID=2856 /ORGANISM="Cylindrotheca closterium" /LENGTH=494 /DNA_ID=CAMNT_0000537947 /DNA_START=169 /DNA_END=1653 /DNA_ORIENTATION=+ /assembly_acc=CAM_ASM_000147